MTRGNITIADAAQAEAELDLIPVHKGFTRAELRAAFEAVQNPKDWKAPISAWVLGEAVMVTVAAIEFYTATEPKVGLNIETLRYLIESEGYRRGPAGDH